MTLCRANTRIANEKNANVYPPFCDYEVSNVEFVNDVQLFARSVTNLNYQEAQIQSNTKVRLASTRICDFININLLEFLGSQTCEDPKNIMMRSKRSLY